MTEGRVKTQRIPPMDVEVEVIERQVGGSKIPHNSARSTAKSKSRGRGRRLQDEGEERHRPWRKTKFSENPRGGMRQSCRGISSGRSSECRGRRKSPQEPQAPAPDRDVEKTLMGGCDLSLQTNSDNVGVGIELQDCRPQPGCHTRH